MSPSSYSLFSRHGDFIFTAGHVGAGADGTCPDEFEAEVRAALISLQSTLELAGSSLADILQAQCVLADFEDFPRFDAVYRELVPMPFPPRMTIGAALAPAYRFEIIVTARARETQS